jgi:PilZ domain-containing protein
MLAFLTKLSKEDWRVDVPERRRARRFTIAWKVIVKGTDSAGLAFDEPAELKNLSSGGAFLYLTKSLKIGAKLDVWIKVPFQKENWMRYPAEVVRVEAARSKTGVAMRFDTARPSFIAR